MQPKYSFKSLPERLLYTLKFETTGYYEHWSKSKTVFVPVIQEGCTCPLTGSYKALVFQYISLITSSTILTPELKETPSLSCLSLFQAMFLCMVYEVLRTPEYTTVYLHLWWSILGIQSPEVLCPESTSRGRTSLVHWVNQCAQLKFARWLFMTGWG